MEFSFFLEKFAIQYGQFEEDTRYRIKKKKVGYGCSAVCFEATANSGSFAFCIKRVRRSNAVLSRVLLLNCCGASSVENYGKYKR